MRLWLFLHLAGFTLWLGGGLAAMVAGITARRLPREGLGAFAELQGAIHAALVGPGAAVTVLSGLILTFGLAYDAAGASVWLVLMQGAGIAGGLLVLFVGVPTAARLRRLDPLQSPAAFDELRGRQRVVGALSGLLGTAALVGGAMLR